MNIEDEGDERQKEGIAKDPEKEIQKPAAEKGLDYLEGGIAEEGAKLPEGRLFRDVPKWAKVLNPQVLKFISYGILIASSVNLAHMEPLGDLNMSGIKTVAALLLLGLAVGVQYLEKAVKKSIEQHKDGGQDGPSD